MMQSFRGVRVDNNELTFGFLIDKNHIRYWDDNREITHEVKPDTIGRCSALYDSFGAYLYEKDRIKHNGKTGTIVFEKGMFRVKWDNSSTHEATSLLYFVYESCQVIAE